MFVVPVHMGYTNSNLEVDDLVRVGAHFVIEAELVVTSLLCRENEIALSLLLAIENNLVFGSSHFIIEIKRTARLYLERKMLEFNFKCLCLCVWCWTRANSRQSKRRS